MGPILTKQASKGSSKPQIKEAPARSSKYAYSLAVRKTKGRRGRWEGERGGNQYPLKENNKFSTKNNIVFTVSSV